MPWPCGAAWRQWVSWGAANTFLAMGMALDSHLALPVVAHDMDRLRAVELALFGTSRRGCRR